MRLLSGGVGTEQARGKTPSDTRIYFEVLVNGRGHNLTCRPSCGCRFFCNTDAQLESQGQEIIFWFWDLGCSNKKFKSTDDYDGFVVPHSLNVLLLSAAPVQAPWLLCCYVDSCAM